MHHPVTYQQIIEIDTLEYQQTEKIETELKDVDRIRIRKKCTLAVQGGILGGHKSAPVSHKHMLSQPSFSSPLINEDLPAGPQLVFTLNNRFFRHQACYSLLPANTVRKMDLNLRSIERMLQTQLSMARRFKLQVLRRYNVKFSKMRNFTLETP